MINHNEEHVQKETTTMYGLIIKARNEGTQSFLCMRKFRELLKVNRNYIIF